MKKDIAIKKIYCLTLERNYERWNTLKSKLDNNLDIEYEKILGIDGSKIQMSDIQKECNNLTKYFFMTHQIYGKTKSHYLLWRNIIKNNNDDEWFIILEDDCIIPDNFNEYIKKLNHFLNKIPKELLEETDLFNLSPTGDYTNNNNLNDRIMSLLTNIISLITSKKTYDNSILYELEEFKLINSNFPLSTHACLVNIKQLKKLVNSIEENKITYHLDIFLNTEKFNINSITPIEIKRGGISDSISFSTTNPVFATNILTLFNKELAYDLSRPLVNILGCYPVSILILFYIIFLLIWQFIDLPNILNDYFSNI